MNISQSKAINKIIMACKCKLDKIEEFLKINEEEWEKLRSGENEMEIEQLIQFSDFVGISHLTFIELMMDESLRLFSNREEVPIETYIKKIKDSRKEIEKFEEEINLLNIKNRVN